MAGGVRIVVAGHRGTGKSSLIVTAAADTFPTNVPPVLSPTRLPDDIPNMQLETTEGQNHYTKYPCYAAFHDEEWGVPVHDDKKLFELLSLSTALAEFTWLAILNKRHMCREVFQDFDPVNISKLNEKKITTPGSSASSLLSDELKLKGVIENARQMCKYEEVLILFLHSEIKGSTFLLEDVDNEELTITMPYS